jgi:hypothetical protein
LSRSSRIWLCGAYNEQFLENGLENDRGAES